MPSKISILTPKQKLFLKEFENNHDLCSLFYLTGGTALAEFYLQHRLSEDLDFFSEKDFEREEVYTFTNNLKSIMQAQSVTAIKKNGRDIFEYKLGNNEILKVEFVHYPYKNLKPLRKFDMLAVNDVFDITVNKIFSVFSRNETKDFADLFFLLKKYSLDKLLIGVEEKFGIKIGKFTLGNELYKARNITLMPKMIKKLTKEQLSDFFREKSRQLGGILF